MEKAVKKSGLPLDVWDKVEIIVADKKERGMYVSRIEDINDDGLVINKPEWVEGGKSLSYKSLVSIQYKKPDAMYRFSAKMRPADNGQDDMIQLYSLGPVERLQRRQFVRIHYSLKLKYSVKKNSAGYCAKENWVTSVTEDISAGGLLFKTISDVDVGDLVLLNISSYTLVGIPRLIVAVCRRRIKINNVDYAGVEFLISDKLSNYFSDYEIQTLPYQVQEFDLIVQNRIVGFIFKEQVRERQKGLI
jgi:c-di-GMP-binding flagellar brake protein YcgR